MQIIAHLKNAAMSVWLGTTTDPVVLFLNIMTNCEREEVVIDQIPQATLLPFLNGSQDFSSQLILQNINSL
jgi:hypothetical protein